MGKRIGFALLGQSSNPAHPIRTLKRLDILQPKRSRKGVVDPARSLIQIGVGGNHADPGANEPGDKAAALHCPERVENHRMMADDEIAAVFHRLINDAFGHVERNKAVLHLCVGVPEQEPYIVKLLRRVKRRKRINKFIN